MYKTKTLKYEDLKKMFHESWGLIINNKEMIKLWHLIVSCDTPDQHIVEAIYEETRHPRTPGYPFWGERIIRMFLFYFAFMALYNRELLKYCIELLEALYQKMPAQGGSLEDFKEFYQQRYDEFLNEKEESQKKEEAQNQGKVV